MLRKKEKSLKGRKGFTLMEVLVTVIIVGVLAAIAYPVFSKSIAKARATEAVNLLEIVRSKQIKNFASRQTYVTDVNELGKLTNNKESANTGYIVVNDKYYVALDGTNACAKVEYRKPGSDNAIFTFTTGYETAGLGCTGNVCTSFGDIIGTADEVCNVEIPVEPEPEPDPCPSGCPGNPPTCDPGTTSSYTCDTTTCQWKGSCDPIPGWCDGQTRDCTSAEGTGCQQTCSGTTWGSCTCDNGPQVCQTGETKTEDNCVYTCSNDTWNYSKPVDNYHYNSVSGKCEANVCPASVPDGTVQKNTIDGVHYCRTYTAGIWVPSDWTQKCS
ncbi:MAG: type IV pilin protein [Elusimicrobiaceae bacterium]